MEKPVYTILISGIIFLLLDSIYLTTSSSLFQNVITGIQRTALVLKPAGVVVCYLFLIFGLYYFILKDKRSPIDAFIFGLVVYRVYEATNYAILKKWPLHVTFIDTVWGGVLFSLTTIITYSLLKI